MNLDEIDDIEWLRKQLKKYCVYVKKDINEYFKAGNWYPIEQNEYCDYIETWDGLYSYDLYFLDRVEDYIEVCK